MGVHSQGKAGNEVGSPPPPIVGFRLVGAKPLGLTEEELRLHHGVDVEVMNLDLQKRINLLGRKDCMVVRAVRVMDSSSSGSSGGGGSSEASRVVLCFAVGGGGLDYVKAVGVMMGVVEETVRSHLGHIRLCKCGH